jgi:GTP cyclohydrolase I
MTTEHKPMTPPPSNGDHVDCWDANLRRWRPAVVLVTPGRDGHRYSLRWDDHETTEFSTSIYDLKAREPAPQAPPEEDFVLNEVTPVTVSFRGKDASRVRVNTPRKLRAFCQSCGKEVRPGMAGQEEHADCGLTVQRRLASSHGPVEKLNDVLAGLVPHGELDAETPQRLLGALMEFTAGYRGEIAGMMKTFPLDPNSTQDPGIVCVRDVPFASLCAHHVLPFTGTASVAYLPSDRIVGLSKIPRLIRIISRRLQTQEFIGEQVADVLMSELVKARGVIVVLRGKHSCMALRGVESPGEMVTSCARGVFRDDAAARAEALSLLDLR